MMTGMQFRLGCAVWAYREWVGELFPKGSRSTDFLRLYSRRFTAVEGNTTFYSVPSQEMVGRWVEETPPEFEFCLKLPKQVTHQGLLAPMLLGAIDFVERMRGLGSRMGVMFAQLPPSYSPTQLPDLRVFLQALAQQNVALALEVRHRDWFRSPHTEQLNDLLAELGVGRVVLDTRSIYECPDDPQLQSERHKPRLPIDRSTPTDFCLVRYISHPTLAMNQPYLVEWVTQVKRWLQQGKQVYFFVHCPLEVHSPRNARHFQALLEQQQVAVPLLPWNLLDEEPPAQLSLF